VPSGYVWPLGKRREVLGLVAKGHSIPRVASWTGVSARVIHRWRHHFWGMEIARGRTGGARTPARAGRPRGVGHRLTLEDRNEIQRGLDAGWSQVAIAKRIGRSASTISREIRRHRGSDGDYNALVADAQALQKARRPKPFALVANPELCRVIAGWMDDGWSPKLIAQVLRRDHPNDRSRQVSHETIYRALYVQSRGQLRKDLYKQLSTSRAARKPRNRVQRRGTFTDVLRISQRPPGVAERAVPGHWEGDLILGSAGRSAIGTLVERHTRFTILLHLPTDHTAPTVATAMIKAMGQLPAHLRRSLTWDRGTEVAGYHHIQLQLQMPLYFADPHSPWQRGSNEYTNRLLRHWFTKGTDLSAWTPRQLQRIQDTLNDRPRPTLELQTPAQRLRALLTQAA